MSTANQGGWQAGLNLVIPGLGIILIGRTGAGLVVGLLFAACANLAIWAAVLIPDEFSPSLRALLIGLAGGMYFGAQLRFAQTLREVRQAEQAKRRQEVLREVFACLQQCDYAGALRAIAPLRDRAANDLLVAYRLAQILTGLNEVDAALRAWRQVRALDRHHIYRDEACANEGVLMGRRAT